MFSKIFILLTSFINASTPVHQDRVVIADVAENQSVFENIRPEIASMYY